MIQSNLATKKIQKMNICDDFEITNTEECQECKELCKNPNTPDNCESLFDECVAAKDLMDNENGKCMTFLNNCSSEN
jgi:hypothetical protein